MLRYELLLLATPEITEDESKELSRQIEGQIRSAKGAMISFERWGKYKLAYPVKKNEYGVYYLARFELPEESRNSALKAIDSLLSIKLNDIVMRSLVSRLDANASLVYQRPLSLEETPKREVGGYFGSRRDDDNPPARRSEKEETEKVEDIIVEEDLEEDVAEQEG